MSENPDIPSGGMVPMVCAKCGDPIVEIRYWVHTVQNEETVRPISETHKAVPEVYLV